MNQRNQTAIVQKTGTNQTSRLRLSNNGSPNEIGSLISAGVLPGLGILRTIRVIMGPDPLTIVDSLAVELSVPDFTLYVAGVGTFSIPLTPSIYPITHTFNIPNDITIQQALESLNKGGVQGWGYVLSVPGFPFANIAPTPGDEKKYIDILFDSEG